MEMKVNEMIKAMEANHKELMEMFREYKFKDKVKFEILENQQKHTKDWVIHLKHRVITNYRKPQIERWYRQSNIALNRARRLKNS
jgi:hypothetical protein